MRLPYPVIRSSAAAALCAAVLTLVGLWPTRAANVPETLIRPVRCGWQRIDSTSLAAHTCEDTLPASATAGTDPVAGDELARSLSRPSSPRQDAVASHALADGTAPIADARTRSRSSGQLAGRLDGRPDAGRAPPAA